MGARVLWQLPCICIMYIEYRAQIDSKSNQRTNQMRMKMYEIWEKQRTGKQIKDKLSSQFHRNLPYLSLLHVHKQIHIRKSNSIRALEMLFHFSI